MSKFYTERQIEELLELRTREIQMPDGTTKSFTLSKLGWKAYDFLTTWELYTAQELMAFAIRNSESTGCSLNLSLHNVVACGQQHARKELGDLIQ